MGLHIGNSENLCINSLIGSSSSICRLIIPSSSVVGGMMLLSYDNYILTDSDGVYLTAKGGK